MNCTRPSSASCSSLFVMACHTEAVRASNSESYTFAVDGVRTPSLLLKCCTMDRIFFTGSLTSFRPSHLRLPSCVVLMFTPHSSASCGTGQHSRCTSLRLERPSIIQPGEGGCAVSPAYTADSCQPPACARCCAIGMRSLTCGTRTRFSLLGQCCFCRWTVDCSKDESSGNPVSDTPDIRGAHRAQLLLRVCMSTQAQCCLVQIFKVQVGGDELRGAASLQHLALPWHPTTDQRDYLTHTNAVPPFASHACPVAPQLGSAPLSAC